MEDLKSRINTLLEEIIYVHLREHWVEKLVVSGINREEAIHWAVEIGEVVDEYRSGLASLAELLSAEARPNSITEELYHWAAGIRTLSISEIDAPLQRLENALEQYLPTDED